MKAVMQAADDSLLYFVAIGLAAVMLAILIQAAHADDLAQDPQRMAKAQELQRYEPGHVFELDDADKHALSLYTARFGHHMPPEKYDFPYDDPLFIQGGYDPDQLQQVCLGRGEVPGRILGCADPMYRYTEGRGLTGCLIRLAREDVIISAGLTLNLVIRHEIGHCNGWLHRPGWQHRPYPEEEEWWRKKDEKAAEAWRRWNEEKAARGER